MVKFIKTESRRVVARGWEKGNMHCCCLMEFQLCKMKKFCTTTWIYLKLLNCVLKVIKMVKLMLCGPYHIFLNGWKSPLSFNGWVRWNNSGLFGLNTGTALQTSALGMSSALSSVASCHLPIFCSRSVRSHRNFCNDEIVLYLGCPRQEPPESCSIQHLKYNQWDWGPTSCILFNYNYF